MGGSKDGGLYRLQTLRTTFFGTWDGLWDDRVIIWRGTDRLLIEQLEALCCSISRSIMERGTFIICSSNINQGDDLWFRFSWLYQFAEEGEVKRENIPYFRLRPSLGKNDRIQWAVVQHPKDEHISFS